MHGTIALDIDGTVTDAGASITNEVAEYLKTLQHDGWQIIFITGRTFKGACKLIERCSFEYVLAPYNGAIALTMPQEKIIAKDYLSKEILPTLEKIFAQHTNDYLVFSGIENNDTAYYRHGKLPKELIEYLLWRQEITHENLQYLESFDSLPNEFSSIKYFGSQEELSIIAEQIEQQLDLHVPVIKDPFSNTPMYVAQAVSPSSSKGKALKKLVTSDLPLIAAGNDNNDLSMLKEASLAIAMQSSPQQLKDVAHIIADDIIEGLQQALTKVKQ